MSAALGRIEADFSDLPIDLPTVTGETITAHGMQFTATTPYEPLVASIANQLQDDVIDDVGRTWPEVHGRPLFASADSGVACWCLNAKPWCAVGQLAGALAANVSDSTE